MSPLDSEQEDKTQTRHSSRPQSEREPNSIQPSSPNSLDASNSTNPSISPHKSNSKKRSPILFALDDANSPTDDSRAPLNRDAFTISDASLKQAQLPVQGEEYVRLDDLDDDTENISDIDDIDMLDTITKQESSSTILTASLNLINSIIGAGIIGNSFTLCEL
jgi:hypothetical protein